MFKKILKLKFRFYEIWKNLFMLINQIQLLRQGIR